MATKNFPQKRKARKESPIQNLTHLHQVLRYKDSSEKKSGVNALLNPDRSGSSCAGGFAGPHL
ncbi:MAG: hypothetical protein JWM21_4895 [Acidobacteria bacterium]|nr:hypothetical protein [Acidobacteriota bacterium]